MRLTLPCMLSLLQGFWTLAVMRDVVWFRHETESESESPICSLGRSADLPLYERRRQWDQRSFPRQQILRDFVRQTEKMRSHHVPHSLEWDFLGHYPKSQAKNRKHKYHSREYRDLRKKCIAQQQLASNQASPARHSYPH